MRKIAALLRHRQTPPPAQPSFALRVRWPQSAARTNPNLRRVEANAPYHAMHQPPQRGQFHYSTFTIHYSAGGGPLSQKFNY